jgi:DMSO/TMAO reductase YedYZ heme-binding membrane subunit
MSRIAEVIEGVAGPASSVQAAKYAIGFANFAGLGAALVFLMLLAISNDLSLRTLKTRRWKSLQRWTRAAFVLAFVATTAACGIAAPVFSAIVPVSSLVIRELCALIAQATLTGSPPPLSG